MRRNQHVHGGKAYVSTLVGFVLGYLAAFSRPLFSRDGSGSLQPVAFATSRSVVSKDRSGYSVKTTALDTIAEHAYRLTLENNENGYFVADHYEQKPFVLEEWRNRTRGGLNDSARVMLADMYAHAKSVFEFGLGESTYIANHVGVQRYAGIDSDSEWVDRVRAAVDPHFRFYLADIGDTQSWGIPLVNRSKAILHYQVAPLVVEAMPFEIYMVDGRWRRGCFFASFLHSAARGANEVTVLVHDCHRYRPDILATDLFVEVRSEGNLCAFSRKPTTSDEQILESWNEHYIFSG